MVSLLEQHNLKVDFYLRERLKVQSLAAKDLDFREICLARCAKDPVWFCDMFVTTYNPRVSPSLIPFCLYPAQIEMINWILKCERNKSWGVCVKARYVGASYVTTMLMLWKLLFVADFSGLLASNKADAVDKLGSMDALLPKIESMYRWLPSWMQTIDLSKNRKIKLIRNPVLNTVITGSSGTEIGRGGRSSIALIDEAAFIEADEQMIAALSENTDTAIFVSTPNSTANQFYVLAQNHSISKFMYRWQSDPRRTPEWRLAQDEKLGKAIAAKELDCSFESDADNQFISYEWIMAAVDAVDRIEGLREASSDTQAGLDVAIGGANKNVITYRKGVVVEEITALPGTDTTQTAFKVDREMCDREISTLCFDADGVGAGVSGTLDNLDDRPKYSVIAFHGGGRPSEREWDGLERTSIEMFANKRIEAWAFIRDRLKKTYDHVSGVKLSPLDELISIPNCSELITDLTKPKFKYSSTGKLILESKIDMRKRGISSPDYGDSLALCFYDEGKVDWDWMNK